MTHDPSADAPDHHELDALLRSPSLWDDPAPEVEDRVVAAITAAHGIPRPGRQARAGWWPGLAAAAVVLVAVAGMVAIARDDSSSGLAVALTGTGGARSASASAVVDSTPRGTRIVLEVKDLAPAPAGRYYEAWLRSDTTTVSAGTFHLRGGTGVLELWCGVDDPSGAQLLVTLEDEGGVDGPGDEVVLIGTVTG